MTIPGSWVVPCGRTDGRTDGRTNGQTDGLDEAYSRLSQFFERTQKGNMLLCFHGNNCRTKALECNAVRKMPILFILRGSVIDQIMASRTMTSYLVLWLYILYSGCYVFYCSCFNLICNVWVCVCVGVLTIVWVFS
jgi:hypothetical protein